MPWQLVLLALVGASLGSLINVLSLRYGKPGALITDRSRCPHCGGELRWWELIPVVSFIVLRGRCARCEAAISPQYPVVEVLSALFWVWPFLPWPESRPEYALAVSIAAILTALLLLFLIDLKTMILPDIYIVYLAILVLLRLWAIPPAVPRAHVVGAVTGAGFLLLLWFVTRGRGIGFGDVKLMIPLGLLLGLPATAALLWVAFVAGGMMAACLLLARKASLKTAVPFGPFLIAAASLALLWPALPELLFAPFVV